MQTSILKYLEESTDKYPDKIAVIDVNMPIKNIARTDILFITQSPFGDYNISVRTYCQPLFCIRLTFYFSTYLTAALYPIAD